MEEFTKTILGNTGRTVGRLGLAASYGAPTKAFEMAFEQGCNYFYYGSGRKKAGMREAIRNLCSQGYRDKLIIAIQTYSRNGILSEYLLKRRLNALGIDYCDALILGWHNKPPSNKLLDRAMDLKEKGFVKYLGMSGHHRELFSKVAETGMFDLFHVRYNAAHRGAEKEIFPYFREKSSPGIITYTATRWGALMNPKKIPSNESPPSATDCYRFVLTNSDVDVCLCGPRNMDQMSTALQSLTKGPLSSDEMQHMKNIGDHIHGTTKDFYGK